MSSLPRSSGNPYVASITSPSTTSYPNRGRRPSNYSSYGFPSTPSTFSNAGGGSNNAYGNPYSGAYSSGSFSERGSARRFNLGRLIKRLLKFPQMDFEIAGWEMLNLMVAPKKVWRQVWYRKQTKNTYTTTDPAFPYLLSFFLLLTSLAWSLAYASASASAIARIAFYFIFVHCLGFSLLIATVSWLLVPRALGPGGWLLGLGDRMRMGALGRRGAGAGRGFLREGEGDGLEWGFAFDIAIRAFLPTWIYLYVVQFLLLPLVARHYWPSTALANLLHVASFAQSTYITFLGYDSIPSLTSTHLLFVPPLLAYGVLFLVWTLSGWNASLHLAPILWAGGGLRGVVGGAG